MKKITKEGARQRILAALMRGMRLTSYDANVIGHTTEGGRVIRKIREDYPVMKENVEGTNYCVYYLDPIYLQEAKQTGVFKRVCEFFNNIF